MNHIIIWVVKNPNHERSSINHLLAAFLFVHVAFVVIVGNLVCGQMYDVHLHACVSSHQNVYQDFPEWKCVIFNVNVPIILMVYHPGLELFLLWYLSAFPIDANERKYHFFKLKFEVKSSWRFHRYNINWSFQIDLVTVVALHKVSVKL